MSVPRTQQPGIPNALRRLAAPFRLLTAFRSRATLRAVSTKSTASTADSEGLIISSQEPVTEDIRRAAEKAAVELDESPIRRSEAEEVEILKDRAMVRVVENYFWQPHMVLVPAREQFPDEAPEDGPPTNGVERHEERNGTDDGHDPGHGPHGSIDLSVD